MIFNNYIEKKQIKLFCWFSILFILLSTFAFAKEPVNHPADGGVVKVEIVLEKESAYLGDPIKATFIVKAPKGTKINLPEWNKLFKNFDLEIKEASKVLEDSFETFTYNFIITPFNLGKLAIPSLKVKYILSDGIKGEINTPEKKVGIKELVQKQDKDIKDIKPPEDIPYPKYFYLIALALLIGLILIFTLLFNKFLKKRKKIIEILEEIKTPYEIAKEKLENLKKQNLLSNKQFKKYYTILSEITREYLEKSFQIPVLDRTTQELYLEMRVAKIDRAISLPVKNFLEICDLVKFAKFKPEVTQAEEDFKKAQEVVETIQVYETKEKTEEPK